MEMKFNWEDFKNGGIRVNCTTEEEAKKFIDMCYENGIYWNFDDTYETYWSTYKENTYYSCMNGKLVYGDISCFYLEDYRETYEFKDVTNINIEKDNKIELKEGMIIECRNGDRYLLRTACGKLVASSNDKYLNLDYYDEELNENLYFDKDFDVMKIYTSKAFILNSLFNDDYLECIWERKEPKKMTLAQISKALGYEVEVIDNE